MLTSQYLLATQKETPSDAEIVSHRLMLRAGMIRKVAAGIYNWLPLGLRVLRKVENIVREEMDAAGAQEVLLPMVHPGELWEASGRWQVYGKELLRLNDRHGRDFCLAPTHEEVITTVLKNEIRSYKQLPQLVYQIQTKFRDEFRPRFGVMRAREFIMKDAYSFHLDTDDLESGYQLMYQTYSNIFERLGLEFRIVDADSGSIGGKTSHEFHVLADSGEDALVVCDKYHYAANQEAATALAVASETTESAAQEELTKVSTIGMRTIADISGYLKLPVEKTVKTLLVKGSEQPAIALVLRGDHQLNEIKAAKHPAVASPLQWLDEQEITTAVGCSAGSVGVVALNIPMIADLSAAILNNFVCGANIDDFHYTGVNWNRDCATPEAFDLRMLVEGDYCALSSGEENLSEVDKVSISRGIEVGHIFQLGDKYSKALNASYLDKNGKDVTMLMGCYGIGVSRIVAASIEQSHDNNGIIWPDNLAPFQVIITPIGYHKSEEVKQAVDSLYLELVEQGFEVLLDDRKERPGVMFADADLIGIPHRIVIGDRSLAQNEVEYKNRKTGDVQMIDVSKVNDFLNTKIAV